MRILAIGDINDEPGLLAYSEHMPRLVSEYKPDLIIVNGENAARGLGLTPPTFEKILSLGADVVTLGNHTWAKKDILKIIDDERLVRPINYPEGTPGAGCRIVRAKNGIKVAVINALGRESITTLVGRDKESILDCPFRTVDAEVEKVKNSVDLIIVDFHAESAIEKKSLAYYLDGRVNALFGTHLHIQTSDECILPKGTAYITDLGMTGALDSVVGIKKEQAIEQYCTQRPVVFSGATEDRGISGILMDFSDDDSFGATRIIRILRHSKYQKQYYAGFEDISSRFDQAASHERKHEKYVDFYKSLNSVTSMNELYSTIAAGVSYFANSLFTALFSYDKFATDHWKLKSTHENCSIPNFLSVIDDFISSHTIEDLLKICEETVELAPGAFVKIFPIRSETNFFGAAVIKLNHNKLELELDPEEVKIVDNYIKDSVDALSGFNVKFLGREKLEELQSLYEVSRTISRSIELDKLLDDIMAVATKIMNCETSSVLLLDEKTNELTFQIAQGDKGAEVKRLIRLKVGQGIVGWVVQTGEPCIVPDTSKDPRFYKEGDAKTKFVTKSLVCVPLKHQDKIIGALEVLNRIGDIPFNDHDRELLELIASQCASPIVNAQLYHNIRSLYQSTLKVLANALDAKDSYTHGHSQRVAEYSVAIASELGMLSKEKDDLEFAALLHDIGKIGIRDNILCKPGKLTDEEFKIIQLHPVMSAEILAPIDFLADKIPIVKHHHERYDGKGYPSKLKGEEIPLGARIICVADTFDAMTSNRSYRKGLPAETALEELKRCCGTQFDPAIVQAFLSVFGKKYAHNFEEIRTKFETQEQVLQISQEKPAAPIVPAGAQPAAAPQNVPAAAPQNVPTAPESK